MALAKPFFPGKRLLLWPKSCMCFYFKHYFLKPFGVQNGVKYKVVMCQYFLSSPEVCRLGSHDEIFPIFQKFYSINPQYVWWFVYRCITKYLVVKTQMPSFAWLIGLPFRPTKQEPLIIFSSRCSSGEGHPFVAAFLLNEESCSKSFSYQNIEGLWKMTRKFKSDFFRKEIARFQFLLYMQIMGKGLFSNIANHLSFLHVFNTLFVCYSQ